MKYLNWKADENESGIFGLYSGERPILISSAYAKDSLGRRIDTRTAALTGKEQREDFLKLVYTAENGLVLTELLKTEGGIPTAQCILSSADGSEVETNALTPLSMRAKGEESPYLWRDLGSKILLVPYDNDMWMRYEAVSLRAGRKSSDVTVLFSEDTREGLLFGAMDFDVWKNALACPGTDARILEARCGADASDESTHDVFPHGTVKGASVSSSRFMILYGDDYRSLLEAYADALNEERKPRTWNQGVPFGFNSYAGLAWKLNADNFRASGDFLFEKLLPAGFENNGTNYVNLDGGWQRIPEQDRLAMKDDFHARGQKAGIYDAPFACFAKDPDTPLPWLPEHTYRELLLCGPDGQPLPRVDGSIPYDVTLPLWREWTRIKADRFIEWGYDYLKIDFLSHAGMEGIHADPYVRTGRQALTQGYRYLESLYSEERNRRPFFLSLSIAPLFPYGYGNARRFSCDAFGLSEDIEYVLNAQTCSWWTNQKLYQYNDPDHIVLLRSFCMPKDSSENEAKARYTSAVIAGSVMLLADDYTRPEAMERTLRIAGRTEINRIAASGTAFRPVDSAGGSASHAYTAMICGKTYTALFAWNSRPEDISVSCQRAGIPEGTYRDLWTGKKTVTENGMLTWHFQGTDAALFVKEPDGIYGD